MQNERMNEVRPEEQTIDLMRLVRAVWKWKYALVAVAVVAAILGYAFSAMFIAPTYQSGFTAYVNNRVGTLQGQAGITTTELSASIGLANLYQEIITSRTVLTKAAEIAGLDYSYGELAQMVKTAQVESTAVITVKVNAKSPAEAVAMATAIAEVAPEQVNRVVDGSSMRLVDPPVEPKDPSAPNKMKNAALCAAAALVLTCALIVILDLVVDKVQSSEEIEERYGIVVIGYIPDLAQADKKVSSYDTNARYHK